MTEAYGLPAQQASGRSPARVATALRVGALVAFLVSIGCRIIGGVHVGGILPYRLDLDVYRMGAMVWRDGHPLYADGALPVTRLGLQLPFTYPPASAVMFVPFTWMPIRAAGLVMSLISIALLLLVIRIALRTSGLGKRIEGSYGIGDWWTAAGITAAALWLDPIWTTLNFGQVNIILMAMVAVDLLVVKSARWQGALTGVAGALKLTPLAFLLQLVVARRWRATATAFGAFIAVGAIGYACAPSDSRTYWTKTVFHTDRIGNLAGRNNQNINGFWRRLIADETLAKELWAVTAIAATVLAVIAIHRCLKAQQPLMALSATAVWGLLVSPTTWGHHWVWAIPAMVGLVAIALETGSTRTRNTYLALTVFGLIIFGSSPYQHMADSFTRVHWNLFQTIVGNSYAAWGLALLVLLASTIRRSAPTVAERPAADESAAARA